MVDSQITMAVCLHRSGAVLRACGILALAVLLPAWSQQPKLRPRQKAATLRPKCAFLRSEAQRIAGEGQVFVEGAPLASVKNLADLAATNATASDWAAYVGATEVFAARRTLLRLELAACEQNLALSNPSRLNEIEDVRTAHIRRVTQRWRDLAGESGKEFESGLVTQAKLLRAARKSRTQTEREDTALWNRDREAGSARAHSATDLSTEA
jgi:hypothetical protein